MCALSVPVESQKSMSGLLELELWAIVGHHVGDLGLLEQLLATEQSLQPCSNLSTVLYADVILGVLDTPVMKNCVMVPYNNFLKEIGQVWLFLPSQI